MKFDYVTEKLPINTNIRIGKRNAYHQAGHVAAIHFGNKQKNLPAVHFQLVFKSFEPDSRKNESAKLARIPSRYALQLEGGRLLANLPYCFETATRRLTVDECQLCRCAFEADVINLLVGSLAEAKYVALRDGEVFNANLVYLNALKFYGGSKELEIIDDYMRCLVPNSEEERQQKLAELFLAAYSFINHYTNWRAITQLAEIIYSSPNDVFTCEEIIDLLDLSVDASILNSGFGSGNDKSYNTIM